MAEKAGGAGEKAGGADEKAGGAAAGEATGKARYEGRARGGGAKGGARPGDPPSPGKKGAPGEGNGTPNEAQPRSISAVALLRKATSSRVC